MTNPSQSDFVVKRQKSGSQSDLAIDLQEIVAIGNDAQFDRLVEIGRKMADEQW